VPRSVEKLAKDFQDVSGYAFSNPALLEQALTHSVPSGGAMRDYERLEFLGDRVLGLVIADALLSRYPDNEEGRLARQLNCLVRKETCAEAARKLGLGELMRTGETTRRGQAQASQNVLGDLCESVIAAIYLDAGLETAQEFIISLWEPFFARCEEARRDPKSALQEWAAAHGYAPPVYADISRTGPDHDPHFIVEARVECLGAAKGEGGSKRKAQQAAAGILLGRAKDATDKKDT